ncbi:MAG: WxL domain-containing protein [Sphaerobacter sp.]|nr:WxL domain-containing protein [Sphaerobacter sp.]
MDTRKSRLTRVLAGMGLAAALAVGAVLPSLAADSATLDGTANLAAGPLDLVANGSVSFSGTLNGQDQTLTTNPGDATITITDATGSGAGWSLSASATQFADGDGHFLPADALSIGSSTVTTDAGYAGDLPGTLTGGTLGSTSTVILAAPADSGMGTFSIAPTFTLNVPAEAYAGDYTSTVTFTLAVTP